VLPGAEDRVPSACGAVNEPALRLRGRSSPRAAEVVTSEAIMVLPTCEARMHHWATSGSGHAKAEHPGLGNSFSPVQATAGSHCCDNISTTCCADIGTYRS